MAVAGDSDGVLVVVAPDPVDRPVLIALQVVCDNHAGLLGVWPEARRHRCGDKIGRLFVREEQRALEPVRGPCRSGKVRTEALEVRAARDHVFPEARPALCWFRVRWLSIAFV